ncbi:hypothetical protein NX059_002469 [Plenodomus lindquistii]|nr:hypothetical protein NX059_002469 [Plenodomus lindquistii]
MSWKTLSALTRQIKRLDLYSTFRGTDQRPEYCDGFNEIINVESRICFDPCDRVYGVIGLMDPYIYDSFVWEPGEKVEDLYPPFVAVLLQQTAVAELLSLNETTERHPGLPSWCPDLHHRSVADLLVDYDGYHAGFNIQSTTTFGYDLEDFTKIRGKGIVVDTIQNVTSATWQLLKV